MSEKDKKELEPEVDLENIEIDEEKPDEISGKELNENKEYWDEIRQLTKDLTKEGIELSIMQVAAALNIIDREYINYLEIWEEYEKNKNELETVRKRIVDEKIKEIKERKDKDPELTDNEESSEEEILPQEEENKENEDNNESDNEEKEDHSVIIGYLKDMGIELFPENLGIDIVDQFL
jgi:hypothetical protein